MIQRTPLCPHVTHPPRLNARRHTTKSTAAARRHRARRYRAALVDEAGTRDRSSERAAVELSTASRHQVPRPRLEEKQHACEPLDLTARAPSDDVFRNTWMFDADDHHDAFVGFRGCGAAHRSSLATWFLPRFYRVFLRVFYSAPHQRVLTAFLTRFFNAFF